MTSVPGRAGASGAGWGHTPSNRERSAAHEGIEESRRRLFGESLADRAKALCRSAEPHGAEVPCAAHLEEASRQLRRARV